MNHKIMRSKRSYHFIMIFIDANFKKQSNLISDVRSKKNGYLEDTAVFVEMLVISASRFECWLHRNAHSGPIHWAVYLLFVHLFCIRVILQQKSHPFPPKKKKAGTLFYLSPPLWRNSQARVLREELTNVGNLNSAKTNICFSRVNKNKYFNIENVC